MLFLISETHFSGMRTVVGVETMRDGGWSALLDRRVAALVHAASAMPDSLIHTVDVLHAVPKVNLSAILLSLIHI